MTFAARALGSALEWLRARARRPRRWEVVALWALGAIVAFACYLRLAQTRAANSDAASQALQAWDMLHGNLLLHGWGLSDVSFYTTEVPQYMLLELVHGLDASVVHVAAAMTYTLVVLLAALLAKGSARGAEGLVRVFVAAGIMLAPQLGPGVNVLMSSPDHIGTAVPVLVAWLILDHARPRWYIPVIVGALLAWVYVADRVVFYTALLPLALVCATRAYHAVAVKRRPLRSQWYELSLAAAAVAAAAAAGLALAAVHSLGGFSSRNVTTQFASGATLPTRLGITVAGLLLLGGADFLGSQLTGWTAITVLHVAGVVLAGWGTWLAARRFLRDDDLVSQVLAVAVVINLTAYWLSSKSSSVVDTRQIAAVLPFGAALAGRMLAGRLMAARLVPVLLIVLAGYVFGLVHEISQAAVPPQNQRLATWLEARHLHTGLSGYWESNIVTLASGDRVRIRSVQPSGGLIASNLYESKAAWYQPDHNYASFVVLFPGVTGYPGFTAKRAVLATFGTPARTYHLGRYQVLVWHKNLLRELR